MKMLEFNATIKTPEDLAEYLRAKSPVYQGHPKLQAEVAMIRLAAADLDTVRQACRMLNTNAEGLVAFVEDSVSNKPTEALRTARTHPIASGLLLEGLFKSRSR